jgi:hypothetical protein
MSPRARADRQKKSVTTLQRNQASHTDSPHACVADAVHAVVPVAGAHQQAGAPTAAGSPGCAGVFVPRVAVWLLISGVS